MAFGPISKTGIFKNIAKSGASLQMSKDGTAKAKTIWNSRTMWEAVVKKNKASIDEVKRRKAAAVGELRAHLAGHPDFEELLKGIAYGARSISESKAAKILEAADAKIRERVRAPMVDYLERRLGTMGGDGKLRRDESSIVTFEGDEYTLPLMLKGSDISVDIADDDLLLDAVVRQYSGADDAPFENLASDKVRELVSAKITKIKLHDPDGIVARGGRPDPKVEAMRLPEKTDAEVRTSVAESFAEALTRYHLEGTPAVGMQFVKSPKLQAEFEGVEYDVPTKKTEGLPRCLIDGEHPLVDALSKSFSEFRSLRLNAREQREKLVDMLKAGEIKLTYL